MYTVMDEDTTTQQGASKQFRGELAEDEVSCIRLTGNQLSVSVMELAKFIEMIGIAVGGQAAAGSSSDVCQ